MCIFVCMYVFIYLYIENKDGEIEDRKKAGDMIDVAIDIMCVYI